MPSLSLARVLFSLVVLFFPLTITASDLPHVLTVPPIPGSGADPFGTLALQGPVPLPALDPVDLCLDLGGTVFGVPTLYVVDLTGGQTYLHDAASLALLGTISNPDGTTSTTGITTDGSILFWAVNGQLYRSNLDGTMPALLGPLAVPGGGQVAGICLDSSGDVWVVDNVTDQYSRHSPVDGSYLGETLSNPNGSGVFGTGLAYRTDCSLFAAPHGSLIDGQVTNVSTIASPTGQVLDTTSVAALGSFITGIEVAASSPQFSVPSMFVIDNASRVLYEIAAPDPCPTPSPDCHDVFSGGLRFSFDASPDLVFSANPAAPISSTLPPTSSLITVSGVSDIIRDVDCQVSVTHTFIGDLDVTLSSPGGGTTVHLFDNAGGSSQDLSTVFDDEGRPFAAPFAAGDAMRPAGGSLGGDSLAAFDGLTADGDWNLTVTDNFTGQSGFLDSWELRLATATPIPDDDPAGVTATVIVTAETEIRDLDVEIAVEHPDVGELTIQVTSPQATTVTLHAQSGVGTADLEARYDDDPLLMGDNDGFGDRLPDGPGALADFDGEIASGAWAVNVVDAGAGATGALTRLDLLLCEFPCPAIADLTCSSDCTTGDVVLTWTNPQTFASLEVFRDGVSLATLTSGDSTYTDAGATKGVYEYEVRAGCAPGVSGQRCLVYHAPLGNEQHVIFAGELPFGLTDSVAALSTALTANGIDHVIIGDLAYPCLSSLGYESVLWACLGTFPHNFVLSAAEGDVLVGQLQAGMSIYFESADAFAFDPPTSFSDYDGVETDTALDGDDSFTGMTGLASGDLDLSSLTALYFEDQFGNDYTDRLLASGTTPLEAEDLGGGAAGLIWQDDDDAYGVGVFYDTDPVLGRVISQSWELGGFGGDQTALVASYLGVLPIEQPFTPFVRGDCNVDGLVDIADAVFLLSTLFPPLGQDPPPIECPKACDNNNDSFVDISDAVTLLSALFLPDMPLPDPFPDCGVDPDMDSLACETFGACP